jgi:hypothetical protein
VSGSQALMDESDHCRGAEFLRGPVTSTSPPPPRMVCVCVYVYINMCTYSLQDGRSALLMAIDKGGNTEVAKLLIEKGANLDLVDKV